MADARAFEPAVFSIIELPAGRAGPPRIKGSGEGPRRAQRLTKFCPWWRERMRSRIPAFFGGNNEVMSRHHHRERLDAAGIWARRHQIDARRRLPAQLCEIDNPRTDS